ncbi:universal stress protein [Ferruginibacter sp. HRS2-29]|uniref:universal stress protein n=1 Tax=Ferruginibacter sp. HRS2-29 TaxID=2487334 RepID=UPI0020CCB0F6|nr:universal stress protein [Ferruginibacter sp. HRS2-29]MCP9753169.1 hypothetical protein [Ferruginibacter sp. HRS2-29]
MDRILIATDFDPVSHHAAVFGTALANACGAKVILCNAFNPPLPVASADDQQEHYEQMLRADALLLKEAAEIDPEKKCVEILCDEGDVPEAIMEMANQEHADLIITGLRPHITTPLSPHKSTAAALAEATRKPLLMVPEGAVLGSGRTGLFIHTSFSGGIKNIVERLSDAASWFDGSIPVYKEGEDLAAPADKPALLLHLIKKYRPDCVLMIDPGQLWLTAFCEYGRLPLMVLPKNHF